MVRKRKVDRHRDLETERLVESITRKDNNKNVRPDEGYSTNLYFSPRNSDTWNANALLRVMLSLRIASAIYSPIGDCDEVFNYWEPLHMFLFGKGLQTWEYSPVYAIRSYLYIYLHYIPASFFTYFLTPDGKIAIFVCLRITLALFSGVAEYYLFNAVSTRIHSNVGKYFLLFSTCSTAMFVSCSNFLPSTFAMVLNMFAIAFFLKEKWFWAIFSMAAAALLGWPFAALLGLPIAVDMLLSSRKRSIFIAYALLCGFSLLAVLYYVDSYYYGKLVLAPLNIVLYNVLSEHGPDLYGVEPLSYYLKNLFLNWNIVVLLAVLGLPFSFVAEVYSYKKNTNQCFFNIPVPVWRNYSRVVLLFLSLAAWLAVFFLQPHKEERFLFPVYPLIAVFAAIGLDALERLLSKILPLLADVTSTVVVVVFILLSLSRSFSVYTNFNSQFEIYRNLNIELMESSHLVPFGDRVDPIRVCVGKDWYRFPSSFYLPEAVLDKNNKSRGTHLHFLRSEFKGLLPKYYADGDLPAVTKMIPTEMNDLNKEEASRYVNFNSCEYVIDIEKPVQMTTALEPNFGIRSEILETLVCEDILFPEKSHWLFRAFYVPILSPKHVKTLPYCLYKRKTPTILQ